MGGRGRTTRGAASTRSPGRSLPPTEQLHPRAEDLHLRDSLEVVERLHEADRDAVEAVGRVLPEIARAADWMAETLLSGGRVFYVGAGTSGRLAALDAAELPPTFGLRPRQVVALVAGGIRALRAPVEGAEDDVEAGVAALVRARLSERDLAVGITASGATPFVASALGEATRRGARTVLICTHAAPRIRAGLRILPETGPELVAGSTRMKAGTATKLVLNAISTAAMVRMGKVHRGRMIDLRPTNAKLQARAVRIVQELTGASARVSRDALRRADWTVREAIAALDERKKGDRLLFPPKK